MKKKRLSHNYNHKKGYPKLLTLLFLSIAAYFIFRYSGITSYLNNLNELSYLGVFIAGLLFSFGFSTPFAVGFFLTIHPDNIFLTFFIGAVGALISDLLILNLTKFSFMDEFEELEETKLFHHIKKSFSNKHILKLKIYLQYLVGAIIIASPLPDELGVTMLEGVAHVRTSVFAIISFIMNSVGILAMLLLGKAFS
ncbi:MAG: hypothetical protein AABW63_02120 [Nanoarchaeota archaeon]